MAEAEKFSFTGNILKVNLTTGSIEVERPGDSFYRKYPGGSAIGTYYCLKEMKAGTDPLGPDNVLVFAPGIMTGVAVSGLSRFTVTAKSPLTGCIGDSQCGGSWGPELKFAGFDAIVIRGRAEKPVYLWIHDGEAEIREALGLWGKFTADMRAALTEKLDDEKIQTVTIGTAGERLVRFACVSGGASNYAGRTGMGAVMGSKNLKAIACRGKSKPRLFDEELVKKIGKVGAKNFKTAGFQQILRELGTAGVVKNQHGAGNLCTRNFSNGYFEKADSISGEAMKEKLVSGSETCFGCIVRCKKVVKAEKPYKLDPAYGGPEFETIGLLGSNLEIDDIAAVARGNQLCNAYGMDTISTGAMIAYATECYENGLLSKEQTGGLEPRFGDAEIMLKMVELIGKREGIGDKLAEGFESCIGKFGKDTGKFAMQVKNNPFAAHMPQAKMSQALAYAVNPFGADHMSCEHDWLIAALGEEARGLGLDKKRTPADLDEEKVRMVVVTQFYYSLMDTLCLCGFCWGPGALFSYRDLEDLVRGSTGWEMSFWEMMKAGERRVNLMRAFNAREGIDSSADTLPERVFKPMAGPGEAKGKHVPKENFETAVKTYYEMMNWSSETGNPTPGKLRELGLRWILEL
ncbi:MAG: aldehyde ferredoxin oxidoreductase family protein [bacterium]